MAQQVAGITEEEFALLFLEQQDLEGTMKMIQDSSSSGPDARDLAFGKSHGLFAGFKVWLDASEKAVWRLVDIRFAFPTAEKARVYHQARLQANSEGHPPVPDAVSIGEDCHVFGGATHNPIAPDMMMVIYYYIFVVNNVVVKLFVAQGPDATNNKLTTQMVASIAKKIEAKIMANAY